MAELINNRERRIETLKEIIQGLHRGEPPAEVKRKLRVLVGRTDASEIAAMEQRLIADGMPVAEVMGMCDLHAQVTREITQETVQTPVTPGHPVDTFRRENRALEAEVLAFRTALEALTAGDDDGVPSREAILATRGHLNRLMDVEKHYRRKEHLLFSILERHGIAGPSKVMWGKDDEVRELLRGLEEGLSADGATRGEWRLFGRAAADPALDALVEMVRKEEIILFPMALGALTEGEWAEIYEQSSEFGYCLVEPGSEYRPSEQGGTGTTPADQDGLLRTPGGVLSHAELTGILRTLPADITFVDAEDRVRFFTEGPARVFARPRAVLGRKVQHCHPPVSVDVVERILGDFRSGRENGCTFWIRVRGRFVLVRYFAVRDDGNRYLGTLEVTQDLTDERALEGERRLLEYDARPLAGTAES